MPDYEPTLPDRPRVGITIQTSPGYVQVGVDLLACDKPDPGESSRTRIIGASGTTTAQAVARALAAVAALSAEASDAIRAVTGSHAVSKPDGWATGTPRVPTEFACVKTTDIPPEEWHRWIAVSLETKNPGALAANLSRLYALVTEFAEAYAALADSSNDQQVALETYTKAKNALLAASGVAK